MADASNIEWCDSTFNPWIGCTKVGPGCDHCYAEADFDHRKHRVQWGPGNPRSRTAAANWKKPLQWNAKPFYECACGWRGDDIGEHGRACNYPSIGRVAEVRRRVFCASLSDVFDNEVDPQWRADLFALIAKTPNLDWLLLTKRVGNAKTMMADALHLVAEANRDGLIWPLPNVWIGATVVNQAEADRDIPKLLATPAAVRFLSMEPLLGPVDLTDIVMRHSGGTEDHFSAVYDPDDEEGGTYLDWVIVGGESGPHARPMHFDWVRSLRDQCAAARVPFLFKQWGEWAVASAENGHYDSDMARNSAYWVDQHGRRHKPSSLGLDNPIAMFRAGKHAAGRRLDGEHHDGYPEQATAEARGV